MITLHDPPQQNNAPNQILDHKLSHINRERDTLRPTQNLPVIKTRIFLGSGHYIYTNTISATHHASCSIRFSNIPWPVWLQQRFRRSSRSFSKLLLLADLKSSPVPPSQTLGVLFFPLSPPSRKGATHNQKVLAPQLASKAELPLTIC
jgi:hypothetical protein